jgi:hypothetical protein
MALCLHVDSTSATRDEVAATYTPPGTDTHRPIPHIRLVEGIESALVERGFMIKDEWHALGANDNKYFGMFEVESERPDYNVVVGFRNFHNKQGSAGLVLGSNVFVCDNMAFSGTVKLQRAHTKFIDRDLPGIIAHGIGKIADMRVDQDRRIQQYKTTELAESQADHLIVQMVRERILMPTHVGKVIKEWDEPRHHEFREDGLTAWRLFNACTEILKDTPMALPRRTQQLHGLMDSVCDMEWREAA